MRTKLNLLVIGGVFLVIVACSPPGGGQESGSGPQGRNADAVGFNILIVAQGDIALKRDGWSEYHPTAFGAELHRGDQLRPADAAEAVVLCDDLRTWRVPAGLPSGLNNGCPPPPEPILVRGASRIGNTRGGADPNIPFIISPRKTQVMTDQPVLQWNEVPSATSYRVMITDAESADVLWETTETESGVVYPGEPPLEAGVTYLLVVEADDGTSSRGEGIPGLAFTVIDEVGAQRMQAATEELYGLGLDDEAETFALAQLYAGYGLYAEAIATLEDLGDTQQAAIYRALGDFYRQVDLSLEAESHYISAVDRAEETGDAEGLAAAQAALGRVTATLGRSDEAARLFDQAIAGYEALGDAQQAAEVAKDLAALGQ